MLPGESWVTMGRVALLKESVCLFFVSRPYYFPGPPNAPQLYRRSTSTAQRASARVGPASRVRSCSRERHRTFSPGVCRHASGWSGQGAAVRPWLCLWCKLLGARAAPTHRSPRASTTSPLQERAMRDSRSSTSQAKLLRDLVGRSLCLCGVAATLEHPLTDALARHVDALAAAFETL